MFNSIQTLFMKKTALGFVLLALIFNFNGVQKSVAQANMFNKEKFTDHNGAVLNYRFLSPDYNTMRKYPLVIFLHGSGERGDNNEAQLTWGITNMATDRMRSMFPAFIVAPQCPLDESWANIDVDEKTNELKLLDKPTPVMEQVIELVHEIMKKHPVDPDRIYITGLSMGGFGTFDALMRWPDLFAAAVPVCGGGDPSKAKSIAHIPMWVFHGAEDTGVDTQLSFKMVQALMEAGAHPGYTQYPEVGHFSWLQAYTDPLMYEWLFRQRK